MMFHACIIHVTYRFRVRGGIGTALVKEIVKRFEQMEAQTVSATIIEESLPFWRIVGFRKTKAFIVSNW